ncbi:MAG: hypothetical protein ACLS7Z_02275 [Christensenellales bacterium]
MIIWSKGKDIRCAAQTRLCDRYAGRAWGDYRGGGAHATRAQLEAILPRFIGEIAQIPPMYSALKRDGQKLCDLARQGIDMKVEPRPTQVYAIKLLHERGRQLHPANPLRARNVHPNAMP